MEKNFKEELRKVLPKGSDVDLFIEELKTTLQRHREHFEHIYDPTKDSFNPQRQYMPFESVKMHDMAGNVLREALYVEMMRQNNQGLYNELFTKESEEKLITTPLDEEINNLKPRVDEVNDIFNAINAVEKITTGELSKKEADTLFYKSKSPCQNSYHQARLFYPHLQLQSMLLKFLLYKKVVSYRLYLQVKSKSYNFTLA
jgi:hypothetical protein